MNKKVKQAKRIQKPQLIHWRVYIVVFFVVLLFGSLVARAAYIQILEPGKLRHESDMRSLRTTSTEVQRGLITDRNGDMLAVSVPVKAIYADPKVVFDNNGFANMQRWRALADVLHQDVDTLVARVKDNPKRRFVYLARQVTLKLLTISMSCVSVAFTLNLSPVVITPVGRLPLNYWGSPISMMWGLKGLKRLITTG